jgi:hypothetical protein
LVTYFIALSLNKENLLWNGPGSRTFYRIYTTDRVEPDQLSIPFDKLPCSPPSSTTESPILEPMSSLNTMSKDGLFNRGVFPPRKQVQRGGLDMAQALNQTSLVGNTFAYNMSCPECDDPDRFRDVYFLLSNDYGQLLKDFQASIGLRSALTGQVCRSYGFHSMDQVPMPSYAGLRLVEFYVRIHHMFSRILNFLFAMVFSRKENSIFKKNDVYIGILESILILK